MNRRLPTRVLLLVLFCLPVLAPERASALAGTCGGTIPCECGDAVITDRTLVQDTDPVTLGSCPGHGLRVEPGVTLDLGESVIRGKGTGAGIVVAPGVGATVTRGRIVGFRIGVSGHAVSGVTVSYVHVVRSALKGIRLAGARNVVTRCRVEGTRTEAAVHLSGTAGTVSFCRIEQNAKGIVALGERMSVSRNVVDRAGQAAIVIGGEAAVVDRNRVTSAGGPGVLLSGTGHQVSRNIASGSASHGIDVSATASAFELNRSTANGGFGIADSTTTGPGPANTYERNVCSANALGDSDPAALCD